VIELFDTFPDIDVQPSEYKRLLGFPRDYVLHGRARELAGWARGWYARNGKPWVYARQASDMQIVNGSVVIEGQPFHSPRLQATLEKAGADEAILVAVGAGPQAEEEAQRLWAGEKPDEYFFLEVYGSAIVEHLTTMTGARLCAWAEAQSKAVLPHYSPGYPEWEVSEQPRLFELMRRAGAKALPSQLEVLDSGMLRPKKSLLAVFGLTRHVDRVVKLTELVPCSNCTLISCQYRRTPYRGAPDHSRPAVSGALSEVTGEPFEESAPAATALDRNAQYAVSRKALRRWAEERLKLEVLADGSIDAQFRYDGTTCTNMGRPLAFDYRVKLGPRQEGYVIRDQHCGPAPGDTGHTFMCRYMNNAEQLMVAIDQERPLSGRPLNDIIPWDRPLVGPGCYCEPSSRKHKWGLVLEVIHFALVQREELAVQREQLTGQSEAPMEQTQVERR
jgi:hypothetical protein